MKRSTIRVRFIGVGRGKATWEQEVPADHGGGVDLEGLVEAIRRKRVLMSDDVCVTASDPAEPHPLGGSVLAGFHTVGAWEVAP